MKKKYKPPVVLFNASVILAGLKSSTGGSAKILTYSKKKIIKGIISEIVLDEVLRNIPKIGFEKQQVSKWMQTVFKRIENAPKKETVDIFKKKVIYEGDAHVLASSYEAKTDFLATLDKKHLLILRDKIKTTKIVSPGELIRRLSKLF